MAGNETIHSTIAGLRDCGTLVIVFLDSEEGRTLPVLLDHRSFRQLADGEACRPDDLIGRNVSYDGDLVIVIK